MAQLTSNQLAAIFSCYVEVYYRGIKVATKEAGDATINLDEGSFEYFGSSETGSNGHFRAVKDGSSGIVTLPSAQIIDKNWLLSTNYSSTDAGATAANASNPSVGAVLFNSQTQTTSGYPLVLYPHVSIPESSTTYESNTSNPFAMLFPHAVIDSGLEMTLRHSGLNTIPLSFKALVDTDTDYNSISNVFAIMDDGIDTDGSYTP